MDLSEIKKSLLLILCDGNFHSGTALSKKLAVSRSAVWKNLNALEALGIELIAVSGKGYRLANPLQLLQADLISRHLSGMANHKIKKIIIHDLIDSTNNYLLTMSRQTNACGVVCLAEFQTAGRGRRGRNWVSPFGSNIYLSLLWQYPCGPAVIASLSLVVGIAVIRVLRNFGCQDLGLKWPNDIYWQDKKLGGILVEVAGESEGPCSVVVGLGLNCYLPISHAAEIDRPWVDLSSVLSVDNLPARNLLAAELIGEMVKLMDNYDQIGLQPFLDEWRDMDCMKGKAALLHMGQAEIEGTVLGINDEGLIQLQLADGSVNCYASGEVSFNQHNN